MVGDCGRNGLVLRLAFGRVGKTGAGGRHPSRIMIELLGRILVIAYGSGESGKTGGL